MSDYCRKCQKLISQHDITRDPDYARGNYRWWCDQCSSAFGREVFPFHCFECNYDVCPPCNVRNTGTFKTSGGFSRPIQCGKCQMTIQKHNVMQDPDYAPGGYNWNCDKCGSSYTSSTLPYHCFGCNYDVCPKCSDFNTNQTNQTYQPQTQTQPQYNLNCGKCVKPIYPQNFNTLGQSYQSGYWYCDVCRGSYNYSTTPYHCYDCKFDVCPRCAPSYQNQNNNNFNNLEVYCGKCSVKLGVHDVRQDEDYRSGGYRWNCDICRNSFSPDVKPFHCFPCNFDVCVGCAPKVSRPGQYQPMNESGFRLQRYQGSMVPSTISCGYQRDGVGVIYAAVAHTQYGDIPGKAQNGTCWYSYGGIEHSTNQFSWVTTSHWSTIRGGSVPPPGAIKSGFQNDGAGELWSAVAHTSNGDIPGKAKNGTCWYPYGGQEHTTNDFSWIVIKPFELIRSPYSLPNTSISCGFQNDVGKLWLAVAHTEFGDIPGKAKDGTCWYPYGGQERTTNNFSWVCSRGWSLMRAYGGQPTNAMPVGNQTDGFGVVYAAVAHTEFGDVPGKAKDGTCWYPYGGQERTTNNFSWVVSN